MDVETGGLEVLERLADEWRRLLEQVTGDDLYSRPEWVLAHLRAYSPDARISALTLRHSGDLKVLLPLVWETGSLSGLPARKICMPLSVPGACNEAVTAPDMDSVESLKALWDAVKSLPGWDVLELRSVYENTPIARLAELAHSEGYKTG